MKAIYRLPPFKLYIDIGFLIILDARRAPFLRILIQPWASAIIALLIAWCRLLKSIKLG